MPDQFNQSTNQPASGQPGVSGPADNSQTDNTQNGAPASEDPQTFAEPTASADSHEQPDGLNLNTQEKSPLEKGFGALPSGTSSQNSTPPPVPQPPQETVASESNEPVKAPDTDEFLKRILEETPGDQTAQQPVGEAPVPAPPVEPVAEPQAVPVAESSDSAVGGELNAALSPSAQQNTPQETPSILDQPEASVPNNPVEPAQNGQASPTGADVPGAQTDKKISDATANLDSIFSQPPSNAVPGQGEEVASDVVGAMQKSAPQSSSGAIKLVGLAVLAIILVGGGYFAYNSLFGTGKSSTETTAEVTSTPVSAVVELTSDQIRKDDLTSLQNALTDYWTNEKKYPISSGLEFLTTSGNSLETALVPVYISVLPQDPDPSKKYAYKSDGSTYTLTAVPDDTADVDAVKDGDVTVIKVTPDIKLEDATGSATSTATSLSSGSSSVQASANSAGTAVSYPPVPSEALALPE